MLQFREALKLLENSKEYKNWRAKNPKAYLSYAFFVVEEGSDNWKIGYYHKKEDKFSSFSIGEKIKIESEDKIFRDEKKKKPIEKLDLKQLNHDLSDAVTIAVNTQQEEYATEAPKKIIAILQTLNKKQIWNITFLTQSFNTLNFKIKSENLRIVEKKFAPLFRFDKGGIPGMQQK
jgi:hypothetical protein